MSFYPHIGPVSPLQPFTGLPLVPVTGFLDSLCADLSDSIASGTNNGWTIYDDMRASHTVPWVQDRQGQANQYLYPRFFGWNGVINDNSIGTYGWTFTSGSTQVTSYVPYGYSMAWQVAGSTGSITTAVSMDRVNWYSLYYTANANNYMTGVLDRPYAGGTTISVPYRRVDQWVVLQCASVQKYFYLLIGCATESAGGPTIYMQPYEFWDATNHVGQGAGAYEQTTVYWQATVDPRYAKMQYMAWFLPDVLGLWTAGLAGWDKPTLFPNSPASGASEGGNYWYSCFTYIGNLDTSAYRNQDPDAVIFLPGQSNYSGYNMTTNDSIWAVSSRGYGAQCLRTLKGDLWWMPGGYQSQRCKNSYMILPRTGKWAGWDVAMPMFDPDGRFMMTPIDAWHTPSPQSNAGDWLNGATDGCRGTLRYAKMPVYTVASNQASNTIIANDGHTYIFVRMMGHPQTSTDNAHTVANNQIYNSLGETSFIASPWAYGQVADNTTYGYYRPFGSLNAYNGGYGGIYNYVLMPIDI